MDLWKSLFEKVSNSDEKRQTEIIEDGCDFSVAEKRFQSIYDNDTIEVNLEKPIFVSRITFQSQSDVPNRISTEMLEQSLNSLKDKSLPLRDVLLDIHRGAQLFQRFLPLLSE
jgi:hypothetical protein